jgi:hypothetical protein
MTNFEYITQSPEYLKDFIINGLNDDNEVEDYEHSFNMNIEISCDCDCETRDYYGNITDRFMWWLNQERE